MTHDITNRRQLARIMYVGLALTAVLMLAPIVDLLTVDSISGHVRDAYPNWPDSKVHQDRDAIAAWLAAIGLLGIGTWYWAIRSLRRSAGRARIVVTTAFALGLLVVLTNLSVGGDGYRQVVPLLYGLLWLVPAALGLLAVVEAWRRPTPARTVEARAPRTKAAHR
ncbi:MAG TPA: hypothetical protein VH373_24355 [Jatrophihabitantaceae bacterium]|jgi:hypothetical protein